MAVFPLQSIPVTRVKVRVDEPYVSEALNAKFLAMPTGIYLGFTPVVTGPDELTLEADPTRGISVGHTLDGTGRFGVTSIPEGDIILDFTGHVTYPVYVVLEGSYVAPPSGSTAATIKTITAGSYDPLKHIKICEVTKPGGSIVVDTTIPTNREEPVARSGVPLGFMPGGSVEDLIAAVATTAEVIAARTGPSGPYVDLDTRLDNELSGPSMASRMQNLVQQTAGTDLTAITGLSTNVSKDFTTKTKQSAPDAKGVMVTNPGNEVRLRDDTNASVSDAGARIYGRLTETVNTALTGTLGFNNASTAVDGVGTLFLTEVDPGDIILGDDGIWYEVSTVNANDGVGAITLVNPYAGGTISGVSSTVRQFTLSFYKLDGTGAEVTHSFTAQDLKWHYREVVDLSDRTIEPDSLIPEDRKAVPAISDFRSATGVDYSNAGDVTTDTEFVLAEGELYAKIVSNDNLQTVEVNFAFSMLAATISQIKLATKFTDTGGTNAATVKILDSDGTVLATDTSQNPPTSTTREEIAIPGASLSVQPTDRFIVQVLVEMDNADECRVGGVKVEWA